MIKRNDKTGLSLEELLDTLHRVLENAAALISEAELLNAHSHFRRAFVLGVIAIEEASKCLILLECATTIAADEPHDWRTIHKKLNNHTEKLKANLLLFRTRRLGVPPAQGSSEWQDAMERVHEMNLLKQAALYVWIGEGGPLTTNEHIAEDDKALTAIRLAQISYNASDLLMREFAAKHAGEKTVDVRTRYEP